MKFFKYVFASALGTMLAGVILLLVFFGLVLGSITAALDDFSEEKTTKVYSNSVLTLRLDDQISERSKKDDQLFPGLSSKQVGLDQIIRNIDKAKEDSKIEGIYLNVANVAAGTATVEAIRNALMDFKDSGKWIISYSEYYSQNAYYLATAADEIYLNPEGGVAFQGISYKPMFMKEMFDKIGVEMQVIRGKDNKFKSAVEPFMLNEMSASNKEQSSKMIESLWGHITNEIAASRGVSVDRVNEFADNLTGMFPGEVLEANFIDGLAYHDEMEAVLAEKLGQSELEKSHLVLLEKYSKSKINKTKAGDYRKKRVALIYANGNIVSGEGDDEIIGSDRIAKAIREARIDTSVKAIVLRVNSPGGSALASDVIWRETTLAADEKPLVVSMGDYAASGGYYISVAAHKIFAEPNTITGSIGVFGVIPNAGKLLNDKVGVYFDGVKTNKHSDLVDISQALSSEEYQIIQKSVDHVYDSFTSKVAEGRGLRQSYVDSIGQGRVWTGLDALEIGLVDEIGGVNEAIAYAAELANIEEYKLRELPEQKSPIEELFEDLGMQASQKLIETQLVNTKLLKQYKYIQSVMDMEGIQAVLPIRVSL